VIKFLGIQELSSLHYIAEVQELWSLRYTVKLQEMSSLYYIAEIQELSSLCYIAEIQELLGLHYTAEDDLHIPFWARSLLTKDSQSLQSFYLPTYTCIWNEILQPKFCMCLHPIYIYLILLHQITFKNWDLKETLTIKFYISALCYPFHTQILILTIHSLTDVKFLCTLQAATLVSCISYSDTFWEQALRQKYWRLNVE